MPARYIVAFLEFIPSMDRHAMVIELWDGSCRVDIHYQNPNNGKAIRDIKRLYINKGLSAVKEYDRMRYKLDKKTVDTTV